MIYQKNNQKKADVDLLRTDKIKFKAKNITKDKEDKCITIEGSIHQEDLKLQTFLHIIS